MGKIYLRSKVPALECVIVKVANARSERCAIEVNSTQEKSFEYLAILKESLGVVFRGWRNVFFWEQN